MSKPVWEYFMPRVHNLMEKTVLYVQQHLQYGDFSSRRTLNVESSDDVMIYVTVCEDGRLCGWYLNWSPNIN
jgi:hypothetical protein